ncbi:ATP-binding cassette domain-containing protein [Nocardioides sp. LHD-245]|uniref:ABC transporter ATP-binding protein n=1 Tax=Nocardioides sp. LHD-245 TaxID=3051387 RepID=UPI0027DEDBB7|nr:ATP-binding cassette domain-containing protein [Nocardioides sp. LHD-245]
MNGAEPEGAMVAVRDLTKRFSAGRRDGVLAVDSVSFEVAAGASLGVVGESGSGKSTLARCLLHLIEPTSGEAIIDGVALRGLAPRHLRRQRRQLQLVPQDSHAALDPRMSVRQIVEEPLVVHGERNASVRLAAVEEMLDLVGLEDSLVARRPAALSGGQRQRVSIARSLILKPRLVVLDEPVSALDVCVQAQIVNLLKSLQRTLGTTYVVILHDLALARYLCDDVAVMHRGRIVEHRPAASIIEDACHPYTRSLIDAIP